MDLNINMLVIAKPAYIKYNHIDVHESHDLIPIELKGINS